jgi:type VI secretion system secreted protein VgrG
MTCSGPTPGSPIDSGRLTLQADKTLTIQGDGTGTITFEQNGGGFTMAPNGDITLFGDEISLSAEDSINFNGQGGRLPS